MKTKDISCLRISMKIRFSNSEICRKKIPG